MQEQLMHEPSRAQQWSAASYLPPTEYADDVVTLLQLPRKSHMKRLPHKSSMPFLSHSTISTVRNAHFAIKERYVSSQMKTSRPIISPAANNVLHSHHEGYHFNGEKCALRNEIALRLIANED